MENTHAVGLMSR
jgi:hypothetical protein